MITVINDTQTVDTVTSVLDDVTRIAYQVHALSQDLNSQISGCDQSAPLPSEGTSIQAKLWNVREVIAESKALLERAVSAVGVSNGK